MHKPEEYIYIRKWGKMLASFEYYIRDQQKLAAFEDAPLNAVYREHETNSWITTDEIENPATRIQLGLPV